MMPLADRTIELSPRHLEGVPARGEVHLAPGEILFRQGDLSDLVYVVDQGDVELVRALADGGEEILSRYGQGEYFGELGPMFRLRRSATARAIGPCRVSGLPVSDFRRSLQQRNGV
jgi:putative ABC transport system ATP-binding protein